MRFIYLVLVILSIGCNLKRHDSQIISCKERIANFVSDYTIIMTIDKNKVYHIDFNKIKIPNSYEKIVWYTRSGKITNLDSINTKLMMFYEVLIMLKDNTCKSPFSREEIKSMIGQPSSEDHPDNDVYFFNRIGEGNCYLKDEFGVSKYKKCGIIEFKYDKTNVLENLNTIYFFPYLLQN